MSFDNGTMTQEASPSQGLIRGTPEWPYYKMRRNGRDGSQEVYIVLMDSEKGRALEKLETDTERLEYMRVNADDSWQVVQADTVFLEDVAAGKKYSIKKGTAEYDGLQKTLQEDGSSWPQGTKEFTAMLQYYRRHATIVEDLPSSGY
ncbi:hypothetical protein F4778DRAFT_797848 [Xylariomycetidae sp. FL2044]|nr:hypothetical protein F4778DRAFT_797848 [Xylariomycetidae sp. FL2044]